MVPPPNAKVYQTELATFWFEEPGILFAISKDTPRTLERQKETYRLIREMSGGKKICLLSDTTHSAPQDKATRDYVATELPHLFKAMAVISSSLLGKLVPATFTALKQEPIPIQFFGSEDEAREWLKEYL